MISLNDINIWRLCYLIKVLSTTDLSNAFLYYIKNKDSINNVYAQLSCDDSYDMNQGIFKLILSLRFFFLTFITQNLKPSAR